MDTDSMIYSGNKLTSKAYKYGKLIDERYKGSIANKGTILVDAEVETRLFSEQVLFTYLKIVQEENDRNFITGKFPAGIRFSLLQSVRNKNKERNLIIQLVKFYNENFSGNKDFIHIPTLNEIINNLHFPIFIATFKDEYGKEKIIGTTTIKFEKNLKESDDPYFPFTNKYILSVNGILTKMKLNDENGDRIRGIGQELFRLAILGAYEISKRKSINLMCKIDCRNNRSIESILHAAQEVKDVGVNANAYIQGYYELQNSDKTLIEAPTFTVGVSFGTAGEPIGKKIKFSYLNCRSEFLYDDIKLELSRKLHEMGVHDNKDNNSSVIFHEINPVNLLDCEVDIGESARGNERRTLIINLFA